MINKIDQIYVLFLDHKRQRGLFHSLGGTVCGHFIPVEKQTNTLWPPRNNIATVQIAIEILDLPSGKPLHHEVENHHAMGKSTISAGW